MARTPAPCRPSASHGRSAVRVRTLRLAAQGEKPLPLRHRMKKPTHLGRFILWRRGRDSNPRVISHKLISSQPRYDRFDTSA